MSVNEQLVNQLSYFWLAPLVISTSFCYPKKGRKKLWFSLSKSVIEIQQFNNSTIQCFFKKIRKDLEEMIETFWDLSKKVLNC